MWERQKEELDKQKLNWWKKQKQNLNNQNQDEGLRKQKEEEESRKQKLVEKKTQGGSKERCRADTPGVWNSCTHRHTPPLLLKKNVKNVDNLMIIKEQAVKKKGIIQREWSAF